MKALSFKWKFRCGIQCWPWNYFATKALEKQIVYLISNEPSQFLTEIYLNVLCVRNGWNSTHPMAYFIIISMTMNAYSTAQHLILATLERTLPYIMTSYKIAHSTTTRSIQVLFTVYLFHIKTAIPRSRPFSYPKRLLITTQWIW